MISKKTLASLCVVMLFAGVGLTLAATYIYRVHFNGPSGITLVQPVKVDVSGSVEVDKLIANVSDTITVTARLDPAINGVPIQFTLNGVNWGSPVNTVSGIATKTYVVDESSANTLTFSARDIDYTP